MHCHCKSQPNFDPLWIHREFCVCSRSPCCVDTRLVIDGCTVPKHWRNHCEQQSILTRLDRLQRDHDSKLGVKTYDDIVCNRHSGCHDQRQCKIRSRCLISHSILSRHTGPWRHIKHDCASRNICRRILVDMLTKDAAATSAITPSLQQNSILTLLPHLLDEQSKAALYNLCNIRESHIGQTCAD